MPSIIDLLKQKGPQTYTDGYGTTRDVYEAPWIAPARKLYHKIGDFLNGKDVELQNENGETVSVRPIGGIGLPGFLGPQSIATATKGTAAATEAARILNRNIKTADLNRVSTQDAKRINDTIRQLFKEYPELKRIGNQDLYKQYYNTIFPASKVQRPYAHGTKSNLTNGLASSTKEIATGAPETLGRDDMYFNLQPETSLQYTEGANVSFGTWNKKRYWPLKEILGKPYKTNNWMSEPIVLRQEIPNRAGQFSRRKLADGSFEGHGKLLEEYKMELGMQNMSDADFLKNFGVKGGDTFNDWIKRNRQIFNDIYNSGNYKGLYHAKIDVEKPLIINGGNTYYGERGIWNAMEQGGNDVLLHNNAANEFNSDVLVVKDINSNPNKVRILGSKPDQQAFADFVGGKYLFKKKQGGKIDAK